MEDDLSIFNLHDEEEAKAWLLDVNKAGWTVKSIVPISSMSFIIHIVRPLAVVANDQEKKNE